MDAGKTERINLQSAAAAVQAVDGRVAITGGRSFKAQGADRPDRPGAVGAPGRANLARRHTLDRFFHITRRLRGTRSIQTTQVRAGGTEKAAEKDRSRSLSLADAVPAAGAPRLLPLRFLPMMSDVTLPPLVIPGVSSRDTRMPERAPVHGAPMHLRTPSWPWQIVSSLAYRLRCWTAPGERRKELRLAQLREKVVGATYVFLNAMQSGEPLVRHFKSLQRQVRRLDRRMGVPSGLSGESARVLREAADRIASVRGTVRDKILSFHREELLYDLPDIESFHHADGILLVMECRMITGIALYGHALRGIAAADVASGEPCQAICQVLATAVAREAKVADGSESPRQAWLGGAVSRLPHRTLMRLHAVLSNGLHCDGVYQDFLDELAAVVGSKAGVTGSQHGGHGVHQSVAFIRPKGTVAAQRDPA
jgi:hypothetical protein